MAKIVDRWGFAPAHIKRGNRLIDKASPFPEIATEVTTFKSEHEKYKDAYEAVLDARSAYRVALGEMHVAEAVLDNEKRSLGFAIVSADMGRRNSTVFRTYFTEGVGATLRVDPQKSLALTSGLITALANEPNPDIASRRDRLQTAYDGLTAAMGTLQDAANVVGQKKSLLESEGLAWRKAFNSFLFNLRVEHPDRGTWIDSLFEVPGRSTTTGEEATNETGDTTDETPAAPAPLAPVPTGGNVVPAPVAPTPSDEAAA